MPQSLLSQGVMVLAKLVAYGGERPSMAQVAGDLSLSASQVHASCATGLFITDPAAAGIRPTVDVDAIVDVASCAGYATLADRLRTLGLGEDTSPGAPGTTPPSTMYWAKWPRRCR